MVTITFKLPTRISSKPRSFSKVCPLCLMPSQTPILRLEKSMPVSSNFHIEYRKLKDIGAPTWIVESTDILESLPFEFPILFSDQEQGGGDSIFNVKIDFWQIILSSPPPCFPLIWNKRGGGDSKISVDYGMTVHDLYQLTGRCHLPRRSRACRIHGIPFAYIVWPLILYSGSRMMFKNNLGCHEGRRRRKFCTNWAGKMYCLLTKFV